MPHEFPYLLRDRDRNGNPRLYVRMHGIGAIRLREEPGTLAFAEAYQKALSDLDAKAAKAKTPRQTVGTLRWLVTEFEASHEFLKVTPREQRNRHLLVRSILEQETKPGSGFKFGDCPLSKFNSDHVRVIRDAKMKTPSAATHRLANLRVIFNWGMEERSAHVKSNPVVGVKGFPSKNKDGWHTWTEQEVEQYEARHPIGTQGRLALDLIQYTGARRGDVVSFGPKMMFQVKNSDTGQTETWLQFKPGKTSKSTGNIVSLPLLQPLRESMSATIHGIETFLINSYGKPHASGDSFANWFRDRCVEAGLPKQCSPHGLRKIGACRAADNGATEKQMMVLFGWSTSRLAAYYSKKANDMKIAAASVHVLTKKGT